MAYNRNIQHIDTEEVVQQCHVCVTLRASVLTSVSRVDVAQVRSRLS